MDESTLPKYFEIRYADVKGACTVDYLSDRESVWSLSIGESVQQAWPDDMSFRMSPERPKDVALVDHIDNNESALLVSPRFSDFLRAQDLPDLEFLPVRMLDHKGRIASSDYRVVNCLRVVDCVDQQKSDFRWDGLRRPQWLCDEWL